MNRKPPAQSIRTVVASFSVFLLVLFLTASVTAQDATPAGHSKLQMSGNEMSGATTTPQPTIGLEDAKYERYALSSMGAGPFGMLLVDQLEYRVNDGDDFFRWDSEGWYGGDFNRFWFKTEGEQAAQGASAGYAEIHGYYSRLVAPFWEVQAGARYDQFWNPGDNSSRVFGAFGLQGFAPYRFEVTPAFFVSEEGDVSFRLTATKDMLLTQRLIAQARFETEVAFQDVAEFGVGDGFNYVELGLRLRYEIRREVAPYIGVSWERQLGETADLASLSGEEQGVLSIVAGLRIWF